ncbi:hypothetical protein F383_10822 [Gossypium arboreum]|uniref:Uncharacterized protein n=1 Tax=Gossypium arboreum TaxID=29729 RepID=A0A0B0NI70_GOSAR|nr:hypothetical protein F383_10822 [Gossypium arboreum]
MLIPQILLLLLL